MTLKKCGLALLLVALLAIGFFPMRDWLIDDALSPSLHTIIQSYHYPENIKNNGYIDFIALERPKEQSLDDFKTKLKYWRTVYDIYQPEKTLTDYSANNTQKFYGVAWLFNCWLTPTPEEGACIQAHAFKRLVLDKNTLILNRYETALGRKEFYADPLVDLNDDFVGVAVSYMATASYYADKGDWNSAVTQWAKQHEALFRFINTGHNSLQSFFRLTQLYHFSLKTAERLIYNGLPPEYWSVLEKHLSNPFDAKLYNKHTLSQELGFYNNQLHRYYRPVFHGFNLNRMANYKNAVPIQQILNSINLGNNTVTGTTSEPSDMKTPNGLVYALSAYIADHGDGNRSLVYLNAQQTALLLGLRLKQADVAEEKYQHWLDNQPERNPFTSNSFRYNASARCISFMDDHKESTCIFMPTFIPQTLIPTN